MRVSRLSRQAALLCLFSTTLLPTLARTEENTTPPQTCTAPISVAALRNPRRSAIVDVVERVKGAVVNIHSERVTRGSTDDVFSSSGNRVNGMGTGIIIDHRGYIVTNHHVVEDVSVIRVRLGDGTTFNARVLAREHEADLALIKIDAPRSLPTMPIGTASDLMVGETVIAVGNAYGYEHSVTVGIVSAIKRDVSLNREISYKSLIQTDASINPGNSGGPLLNVNGELIGVNVAIRAGAQGIGFAIPVDTMLRVVAEMLSVRRRNGLWHGMVYRDQVSSSENTSDGIVPVSLNRSVALEKVENGSPADKATLQKGDVLIQIGTDRISTGLDVERALLERKTGDKVPVVILRKGSEKKVELVLQSLERSPAGSADLVFRKVGLRLAPANSDSVSRTHQQLRGGLTVLDVQADSAAARAGIVRGDVLIGLHQWETINLDNVLYVLNHAELSTFMPLRFYIVRAGTVHSGNLQNIP